MKMPGCDESYVPAGKISDYLLSKTHEHGKSKEAFFSSFGFTADTPLEFEEALLKHARERDVQENADSDYGKKYVLQCELKTPDSRNPCIVTVWLVENDATVPKLITAYPAKEKKSKPVSLDIG